MAAPIVTEFFPASGERVSLVPRDGHLVIESDEEAIGKVELEAVGDVLTVSSLCIEANRRGYGAGTDATRILVRAARESGRFRLVRTAAPPDRGLAVYFWSRMGFRAIAGEGPDGGLWFELRLD